MLSRYDLKEYRLLRHLTLRDVARYCDVSHELISQVERGVVGVTKYNHEQIIKGINAASQARVRGTFENDREKESQMEKAKAEEKKKQVPKTGTQKKTTRKSATKQ